MLIEEQQWYYLTHSWGEHRVLYLSQRYYPESEYNNTSGVWTHLLQGCSPTLQSLHHRDTPQKTPEEGQIVQWLKHCKYNNQEEDVSSRDVNNSSSKKFRRIFISFVSLKVSQICLKSFHRGCLNFSWLYIWKKKKKTFIWITSGKR